jgi:hypothetical protein
VLAKERLVTARTHRGVATACWTALAIVALLWPARAIGPLDGAPLDSALDAILIGVCVPFLWALQRSFLERRSARVLVSSLIAWKLLLWLAVTPQGLCAKTAVRHPLDRVYLQMPIREPSGVLRSWDVRADFNAPAPACTAILTRPLPSEAAFPAWFVNITDHIIGRREIDLTVRGFVTLSDPGVLTIATDRGVTITGEVGSHRYDGAPVRLDAGTHAIALAGQLTGEAWRFEPRLDEASLWSRALVTTAPPTRFDRLAGSWAWIVAPALVLLLTASWLWHALATLRPGIPAIAAALAMGAAAVALALQPVLAVQRGIGLLAFGAVLVPVSRRARNIHGVLLLVGLPWVAFFAARSFADIGRFTAFSADDWLAYQLAGYRIFMHGYYFEGGTLAFDYQPLYRWINGALHLVFGDSSVGEHYWDAACLALGASLSYHIVRARAGYRWGVFAAAATLSSLSLGTPWHFIGRSLSEVAAAGWAFLAMLLLLRGRRSRLTWSAAAGASAVLMFYTRLNHLLFAAFLPALLLPLEVPAVAAQALRALARVRRSALAVYVAVFGAGVVALMTRTWWYTGQFSLFYGTSLNYNDTGLRSLHVLNPQVWSKVLHSLASFVFMNEPPRPDVRATFVIAGVVVAIAALCQVPRLRQVPAAVVITVVGASAASFVVHGHPYPGRFSIHLVPLAVALSTIALAGVIPARSFVAPAERSGAANADEELEIPASS